MKTRTFRVGFSRIVPEEAQELEFADDDYVVIRPIRSQAVGDVKDIVKRMQEVTEETADGVADSLVLDILERTIVEWHLSIDGTAVPVPKTDTDLARLPASIAGSLLTFLVTFRGDPTTPG